MLSSVAAFAVAPGDGIENSKHDFSDYGGGVSICMFCHTPHRAISTKLLWNHTLSQSNFSWDVPATTAGTSFPSFSGDSYTGPTSRCLSCHDGTVAVGDIGWYQGGKPATVYNLRLTGAYNIAPEGNLAGNHPTAMPIPFGNQPNTYNGVSTGPHAYLDEWQADPQQLGIRLFNDDGAGEITAGAVPGKSGIECSSCHDPHNKKSVERRFLRGSMKGNDQSYLCLKCHRK
ncbi:MAG: cytochrome c3 family protein [Candidatus Schekmanbacteria bacterium]|nr:cytochrome c3 family protein [Candidatus Schekmanbacteria bacterium]